MKVTILKDVGFYKAGAVVEMEYPRAQQYITAKMAKEYLNGKPKPQPQPVIEHEMIPVRQVTPKGDHLPEPRHEPVKEKTTQQPVRRTGSRRK